MPCAARTKAADRAVGTVAASDGFFPFPGGPAEPPDAAAALARFPDVQLHGDRPPGLPVLTVMA
ncbi:MAG TPA: hypothetical protein VK324_07830 [Tepidisphaeraceae bacterium]|nr:hypothetical protein [Tepidisphaeraceae bacterium]